MAGRLLYIGHDGEYIGHDGEEAPTRISRQPAVHSWAVYRLRGTPAAFGGLVYATDEQEAIAKAAEEFQNPARAAGSADRAAAGLTDDRARRFHGRAGQ